MKKLFTVAAVLSVLISCTVQRQSVTSLNGGPDEIRNRLENLRMTSIDPSNKGFSSEKYNRLCLLAIADIHADAVNMRRLAEFRSEFGNYFDDAIVVGDVAGSDISRWNPEFDAIPGFDRILLAVGNHDCYQAGHQGQYVDNWRDVYALLLKNVSKWGVCQPLGAEDEGLCYYYKDYPRCGIRLIVLDGESWLKGRHPQQEEWFRSTLEDARRKGLSVVAAQHRPTAPIDGFDCGFHSLDYPFKPGFFGPAAIPLCVDEFQRNGGEFICWLCGHTHSDFCGTLSAYPGQLIVVEALSKFNSAGFPVNYNTAARIEGTRSQDLFNVLAIDTRQKLLIVHRFGADRDSYGRGMHSMTIDYSKRKLVSSE